MTRSAVEDGAGFRVLGSRTLAHSSHLHCVRRHIVSPTGHTFTRDIVLHPGAVAIVPILDSDVFLIRQYRAPVGGELLEVPAGKLDVPGESPEAAAQRECVEEVGMRPGRLTHLATFYSAPGFCDEVMWVYRADELEPEAAAPAGAEEEVAAIVRIPLGEALALIDAGEIIDAKTIIGLRSVAVR